MKRFTILFVLLFACATWAQDVCTPAAGVHNRFWVKVVTISERNTKCGGAWTITGENYLNDLLGLVETWDFRLFQAPEGTAFWLCTWGDPLLCDPAPEGVKVFPGDVVFFDAMKQREHARVLVTGVHIIRGIP